MSAILDRQGLLVAAPKDLGNKNADSFSTATSKSFKAERSDMATVQFVFGRDRAPNP